MNLPLLKNHTPLARNVPFQSISNSGLPKGFENNGMHFTRCNKVEHFNTCKHGSLPKSAVLRVFI